MTIGMRVSFWKSPSDTVSGDKVPAALGIAAGELSLGEDESATRLDSKFVPAGLHTGNIIWPADPAVDGPGEPCDCYTGQHIQARTQEYRRFRHGGGAIMCLGTMAIARPAWAKRESQTN